MQWCLSHVGCALRCICDLAFYFWSEQRSLAQQREGAPTVSSQGEMTQTSCWELRGGLRLQEFHRNGHWRKKDSRHHVIDSRNLCCPIKTHKPHRALGATGSHHCPSHPVLCSIEDFLVYWLIFCSQPLSLCCIRMKWLKHVCKPEMLSVRSIIIVSFGKLIRSLN